MPVVPEGVVIPGAGTGDPFRNAGVPVNGTSGTFAKVAAKGALLIDITNGTLYQNTGTLASPTWTQRGAGAGSTITQQAAPTPITNSSGGAVSDTIPAATNTDALTDSTGGTPATTLAAITAGAAYAQADMVAVKNNQASLAAELAKQRTLNTLLINATASDAAKIDTLITLLHNAGVTT